MYKKKIYKKNNYIEKEIYNKIILCKSDLL